MSARGAARTKPMKSATTTRRPQRFWQLGVALFFALFGLVVVSAVGMIGYQILYRDRIHRGVQVWNLQLGGLTRPEAESALAQRFGGLTQVPWEFRDGEKTWSVSPAALGIRLDAAGTAEAAYAVGRSGTLAWNLGEQLGAAARGAPVSPVVLYDEIAARTFLEGLSHEIYRPIQEASLTINGSDIYEVRPQVGRQLNIDATLQALQQTAGNLERRQIDLVVHEYMPRVIDAGIAHKQADEIIAQPATLYVETEVFADPFTNTLKVPGPWQLSEQDLARMLFVRELPVGEEGSVRLDVTLSDQALRAFLAPLSTEISRTAKNARFIFNDETRQLEVIRPSVSGLELDIETTLQRIKAGIEAGDRQVPVAVRVVPAEINENLTAESLGITELIASSTSYYVGSSEGRRNNVQVAASKFHGVVIKPGQVFSFNEWLGEVTEEEGYDESLIIFGNETIPDVGGGVCQVSTTAYRAAFWAGFPIVERWAHAYRVGYYEQGNQPVGFDATIYSPDVDLKFVNDSPYHLLVETYTNSADSSLTFKFYSTGQGRTIELEGPEVFDVIEHGDPVYKEDPDIAPGQIKQVEWATNGLTSVITRVIRNVESGEVISREEFTSKFRPWNAVYLVGPGTDVPGHDVIRLNTESQAP
jgi:vancomycin resistance protein YoaR